MMVPRSYRYLQPPSPPKGDTTNEKMGSRSARPKPVPVRTSPHPPAERPRSTMPDKPSRTISDPVTVHSKPVVIPPRTPSKSSISTQSVRARGHNGGRRTRVPGNHKPDAIPPAVAALLAVTAIPPPTNRRRKGSIMDKRISIDELIQEWRQDDCETGSSLANSPLDWLLERPDETDEDDIGSIGSAEQEKDFMTSTSVSSISEQSTLPSLDQDATPFGSYFSSPPTPTASIRRVTPERKERVVQSPPKEDCILDHPLLHFNPDHGEEISKLNAADDVVSITSSTPRFKSFKSNLTASFQALKSAAKSFSNFTAPSIPPDDLLTRSLLSPRFTSEMRPKQLQGVPSPALRRYLNPQHTATSAAELSMQLHDALMFDEDPDLTAPMIQMQTYDRRSRSSSRKRRANVDPLSEAGRALSPSPTVRQREPRENSDFLRVIVLEMNMRREGKLNPKALGKARIWLPPRKSGNKETAGSGVPIRWVGILSDEC